MSTQTPIRTFHLNAAAERAFAYAQATSADGLLHVAGTLSLDEGFAPYGAGDMRRQVENIYARLGRTLAAHGIGPADVLRETGFVTDMEAFLGANDVRAAFYGSHTPACTIVEVRRLAFPDCLAEIELTARLGR